MEVLDMRALPPDSSLAADVCIVGTGPAGLTLAHELSGSGRRTVVLESGDHHRTDHGDALNAVENVGAPRTEDQWAVRNRVLGGTSVTWSGRLATFDDVDFAVRDWVPWSGWPLSRDDLRPYFVRTLPYLGSATPDNNGERVRKALADSWPGINRRIFRPYAWSYSHDDQDQGQPMRFAPRALRSDMPGVTCFVNASVTQIQTEPDGARVSGVEVRTPDGQRRAVRTRFVVLCTGAIENARLLLASNRTVPTGLGNGSDLVGRFLMDHLRAPVGTWAKDQQFAVQRLFADVEVQAPAPTTLVKGLALTPEIQHREQLLNCALFIHTGEIGPQDPLRALRSLVLLRQPRRSLATILASREVLASNAKDRLIARRPPRLRDRTELTLQCMVEQRPDPDSRVTLSRRPDPLGLPLPVVDWRVSEQEKQTVRYACTQFAAALAALGQPVPDLERMITDSAADFLMPDVAHPTGTTRMSADPRLGVVDRDCEVHGVNGLYAAGSSVFPTSGHANPTQMIVALAVRLADHLKGQLRAVA